MTTTTTLDLLLELAPRTPAVVGIGIDAWDAHVGENMTRGLNFLGVHLPETTIVLYCSSASRKPLTDRLGRAGIEWRAAGPDETGTGKEGERAKKALVCVRESDVPAVALVRGIATNQLDGVVRGTLPSTSFLHALRAKFEDTPAARLALLETAAGIPFWYAPVGIDEDTPAHKRAFVTGGLELARHLGLPERARLLSGGRLGDKSRAPRIARSIGTVQELVEELRARFPGADIQHGEILIERAIQERAAIVIAPDGISGNLIYRTLVHLGDGHAFGASYLGIDPPCIDTSRAGNYTEFVGAVLLARILARQ